LGRLRGAKVAIAVSLAIVVAGASGGAADTEAVAERPSRVVSMNLCTDQLAMLVAAPGQLLSVTYLATDPRSSAMVEEAEAYRVNHGLAEDIYLMQPDLVIAGSFTTRATVEMLQRLGLPVVIMEPAYSLDDVSQRLAEMGEILGRQDYAATLIDEFEARLAALRAHVGDRPSAALYYANGYTSGDRSLAGQILTAAGFENAAVAAGFAAGGVLPLEVLALLDPDALVTGRRFPGASRAEDILDHPVVQEIRAGRATGAIADSDWVCGTPFVLRAIEGLSDVRRDFTGE